MKLKNNYFRLILIATSIALIACAPKIDPVEIVGCVDGEQFAKFREFCTGEKPITGSDAVDGQFDPAKCSEVYLTTKCNDPSAMQIDMSLYPPR